MSPDEVSEAIGKHLLAMPDCPPVIWPNRVRDPNTGEPIIPEKPYLVVQDAAGGDHDDSLSGGAGYSTGRVSVVVVFDLNRYDTQAKRTAWSIKQRFHKGLRLSGVTITGSSVSRKGYPTETDWRVPVAIDWIAV